MKNISNALWALLLVAATVISAGAQNAVSQPFSVQIEQKDGLRLGIYCQKTAGQKLILVVKKTDLQLFKSPYAEVIYEESIAATATEHVRMFNLSQLGEGTYQIEISGGGQRFGQTIEIRTRAFRPQLQEMELVVK
jgi:hypothetical protein